MTILSFLIWHIGFGDFPTDVTSFPKAISVRIFTITIFVRIFTITILMNLLLWYIDLSDWRLDIRILLLNLLDLIVMLIVSSDALFFRKFSFVSNTVLNNFNLLDYYPREKIPNCFIIYWLNLIKYFMLIIVWKIYWWVRTSTKESATRASQKNRRLYIRDLWRVYQYNLV